MSNCIFKNDNNVTILLKDHKFSQYLSVRDNHEVLFRRINTFLNNSLGHLKLYSKQIDTAQQELADKKPPTYSIGKLVKKTNSLSKRMKSARSAVSPRSNIRKFRKDN